MQKLMRQMSRRARCPRCSSWPAAANLSSAALMVSSSSPAHACGQQEESDLARGRRRPALAARWPLHRDDRPLQPADRAVDDRDRPRAVRSLDRSGAQPTGTVKKLVKAQAKAPPRRGGRARSERQSPTVEAVAEEPADEAVATEAAACEPRPEAVPGAASRRPTSPSLRRRATPLPSGRPARVPRPVAGRRAR